MDNLKRPAQAQPIAPHPEATGGFETSWGVHEDFAGFTKLEKAALMIAQGMIHGAWSDSLSEKQLTYVKETAVGVAKAVLEEANK